jgi:hypothetical protein
MANNTTYTTTQVKSAEKDAHRNLAYFLQSATDNEIELGLSWYAVANDTARTLSRMFDISVNTAASVLAALSPRVKWQRNIECAFSVCEYWQSGGYVPPIADYTKFGGTMQLQRTRYTPDDTEVISDDSRIELSLVATKANIIKALWILQGYDVLSGKKVVSFRDNILGVESQSTVTVDSHAIQAYFGNVQPGTYAVPGIMYQTIANYYLHLSEYMRLAQPIVYSRIVSIADSMAIETITASMLQAIIWLVKKRLSGSKYG